MKMLTETVLKSNSKSSKSPQDPATRSIRSVMIELAEPLVPIPPDGGWGWLIVASVTFIMFCIDGFGYCFAIFFEEIQRDFKCSLTEIALVTSISGGFYYLLGPITCSILNKMGFQLIAVIGGLLASLAFLSASFMTTLLPFTLIVGCLGGISFNLMYSPTVVAVTFYFERWRALAMSICCCGSSLGIMAFPIIMEKGLKTMGWRAKFRLMSVVMALCGVLGMVYKPIKSIKVEKTKQFEQAPEIVSDQTLDNETEIGAGIGSLFQRFKNASFPTISEMSIQDNESTRRSNGAFGFYIHHSDDDANSAYIRPNSQATFHHPNSMWEGNFGPFISTSQEPHCCVQWRLKYINCCASSLCSHCCLGPGELSLSKINRPLYRDDIFYGGSVYRLAEYLNFNSASSKGLPSLAYTLSVSRAPTQRDLEQQTQCVCCPEAFLRVFSTMLNIQVLKSPTFIILLFSGYLSLMSTYIIFVYMAPYAQSSGVDEKSSSLLLSAMGMANTLGRAVCGGISCFPMIDLNRISYITISISGAAIICMAFANSETQFIILCVIFGFNLASFAVLRALVFVELFGLENLTNCFGLNMLSQALAAFTGTPIANFIYTNTGSFTIVFLFSGLAIVASGVMLIPLRLLLKWEQGRKKKATFTR
ncbi:monocarboxylate transporter 2-like [Euwallacea similis]|uniref:monocarboxylate transporter 2-like n=1 Tax=Euwallacea similis TaxID=1736056 RepID=UPI00344C3ED2